MDPLLPRTVQLSYASHYGPSCDLPSVSLALLLARLFVELQGRCSRIPTDERPPESSSSSSMSKPPCLAETLAPYLALYPGKRKRSITHFEGIPVGMLARPAAASGDRKVITPKRVECLGEMLGGMSLEGSAGGSASSGEDEDDVDSDDEDVVVVMEP